MFAPRTGFFARIQSAPAFGQSAVHRGVRGAGELDDLGVAVAGRLQKQVASLARAWTLEAAEPIGVLLERDQPIDGLASQSLGVDHLARIDRREESANRRLAAGKARELPPPPGPPAERTPPPGVSRRERRATPPPSRAPPTTSQFTPRRSKVMSPRRTRTTHANAQASSRTAPSPAPACAATPRTTRRWCS